jgi:tRNA-splicing ligase RtcB (3'-phosphate/5'-hydroxy nucleic acid ligase)
MSDAPDLSRVRPAGPMCREIPPGARAGMLVPARVFADDALWDRIRGDRSLTQLANVATLRGVTGFVCAMPDVHEGYGFPVGGVAATAVSEGGLISPGGVGYDINCGVRLLVTELTEDDLPPDRREALVHELARTVPSGAGRGHEARLAPDELLRVLAGGSQRLAERGFATEEDLAHTEAGGCLAGADPGEVSGRALTRGLGQLGTLGSGNHFLEVQAVERLFDSTAAATLGLALRGVAVLIHTGSRGLGHQVCTDWVRRMDQVMPRYGVRLPDRELAAAPFESPDGRGYFGAMCAAANFAWANRQMIAHLVRGVFARFFGDRGRLRLVYDVAHNIAKLEDFGGRTLCVHRKGATRAFGPSHPETPAPFRAVGQPVFIPGSMGTRSYVLAGTDGARDLSFASCCHGAGRAMSRTAARRARSGQEVRRDLEARGITVRCPSPGELAEEAPAAYKDVDRVVEVVERAGLATRVASLRPLGVVKG